MNKYYLAVLIFLAAMNAGSSAQTTVADSPPPPKPPYVVDLPANSSWTITFSPKSKPGTGPAAKMDLAQQLSLDEGMARIEVTKKGRLQKRRMIWLDGRESEDWVIDGTYFHQDPDSKAYAVTSPSDSPYGPGAAQRDFPDLSWINSSRFTNIEKKGTENCFVYKWTTTRVRSYDLRTPFEPTVVWISMKTDLPLARESADLSVTYGYPPPSNDTLSLPAECQKLLDIINNYQKRLQSERPVNSH